MTVTRRVGRSSVALLRFRRRCLNGGVEVRRIFHQLRSHAIENFNGYFNAIFDARQPVPTRRLLASRRFALGAVLVYQFIVWQCFEVGQDLRVGLKYFIKAA